MKTVTWRSLSVVAVALALCVAPVLAVDGASIATVSVGAGALRTELGDLDGDGDFDALPGNQILLGDGAGGGTWNAKVFGGTGGKTLRTLHAGDVDGDGRLDLVVASPSTALLSVFRNDGFGGFLPRVDVATALRPDSIDLGDVDGDDDLDLLVGHGSDTGLGATGRVSVHRGDGSGGFSAAVTQDTPGTSTPVTSHVVAFADGDGDGLLDGFGLESNSALAADRLTIHGSATSKPGGIVPFGTGTPGCRGLHGIRATSAPVLGSICFRIVCTHGPPDSLGLGLVSDKELFPGSDPFGLGVLLHVDLLGTASFGFFDIVSDRTGQGSMLQDLPAQPSLLGTRLFAQVLWVWVASCVPSPYLLSTSPGLEITPE